MEIENVLMILKKAAKDKRFGDLKVDPNSIQAISPERIPTTPTPTPTQVDGATSGNPAGALNFLSSLRFYTYHQETNIFPDITGILMYSHIPLHFIIEYGSCSIAAGLTFGLIYREPLRRSYYSGFTQNQGDH